MEGGRGDTYLHLPNTFCYNSNPCDIGAAKRSTLLTILLNVDSTGGGGGEGGLISHHQLAFEAVFYLSL